jgi:competence protein ComEC
MSIPTRVVVLLLVSTLLLAGCTAVAPNPESPTENNSSSIPSESVPTSDSEKQTSLEVHFINVGQGSSTLLVGPTNETMLIDSGDWRSDGEEIIEYLEGENITHIDYLITSHADADHIGGHAAIINHFETEANGVGAVYDPGIAASTQTYESYLDAIEEHDVELYRTQAGDQIPFEGASVDVLAPPANHLVDGDRNENSLVLRVAHGNASFLFPGDAAERGEQYLVDTYGDSLNSTVLQAGHHGSRSSSSADFLDATTPSVTVISSGYDSQYGHPHEEVLQRLADREIPTLWTATHGTVTLVSNETHVTMFAQARAITEPQELRSAPAYSAGVDQEPVRIGVIDVRTVTPVVPDGGAESTSEESSPNETDDSSQEITDGSLGIETIHADASGNDHENLNDEYIVLANTRSTALDLTGWSIEDAAGHEYTFPDGFTLDPSASVTLYSGSGTDTADELYWGSERAIWNNGGDTIIITDEEGAVVLKEAY